MLVLALAVLWFASLDHRKLIRPDEGRYATIAQEMALSGDWVTPRLNGLIYFEKPPLQYWATAAAMLTFGQHDWVARLWPALTGFLGVLLAAFAGARLFGVRAGVGAAAVLASSLFYFAIGHMNTLDMGLCFFLQLALCGYLLADKAAADGRPSRNWMLIAWAAAACAALSKGLIALVIPGAALFLHTLVERDLSPWKRLHPVAGLGLFLLIAAPWHLLAQADNPQFADFYFVHEHFQRFLTTTHARVQPWWYYLPLMIAATVPWSLLAIHAVIDGWKQPGHAGRTVRFLLLWSGFTLAFFSASGSKLPSYILPILPALALVVGQFLTRISPLALRRHLMMIAAFAALALAATLWVPLRGESPDEVAAFGRYRIWLVAAAAIWLAASLIALRWAMSPERLRPVNALAAGGLALAMLAAMGHECLADSHSSWRLVREVGSRIPRDAPLYAVRQFDHTLPYYLHRSLTLVEYRDEMDFGLRLEPDRGIADMAEFERRWRDQATPFAVMAEETHAELAARGLPMEVVGRDPRQVIVTKPKPESQ